MLWWPNHPIRGGRPPHLAWGWFGHPQAGSRGGRTTPKAQGGGSVFFFFFFLWGHFGNKKAKWVKLSQFESLGGLSVTFKTLEAKVKIGGYFRR
jgi:hypothetical protein